ncbi:hypothetical protein LTR36_009971 [Oleoguttula mirabilis]|uniref:Uncharacterized protein n=1 Tax=Oleoguttula mirabilis TaxID=1507867 RepID=A0AAV9J5K9_9PEZI|nr:hypothetical protein LTR36_009971 [Oleoguttula mirabilis]
MYGVNPIPYLPPPPAPAELEARKAEFRASSMAMKREMLVKLSDARAYIPVDARGELVWSEAEHGEFAVLVVKIDKGRGLQEFGSVG